MLTLAPTTQFWDASEYIAAAYVLGIPHPPGNPLFVLLAHVWGMIPFAAHYAVRINLFAAVTGAVTASFWFLIGERWLRSVVPGGLVRKLCAAAGALIGATAFSVWNQSVANEKVYTVSLLSISLVLWLTVVWRDREPGPARNRLLLLIGYLIALTATNHLMGVLVAPAVLAVVLATDAKSLLRPRLLAGVALVTVLGLSVNLFLLLRAAHFPAINEGEPSTWEALIAVLQRDQYGKPPLDLRQADLVAQLGLYWQYFTWQWGRTWQLLSGTAPRALGGVLAALFASLGLVGAWRHWRADKVSAAAMTTLMVTLTLLLVVYLNFKYGFSQYLERPQLLREVRERDYFFIASFSAWGVWVGFGLVALMERIVAKLKSRFGLERAWSLATPLLLLALVPLVSNWTAASRRGETLARDFGRDLLNSLEPYAVLFTYGDNDQFPIWYAQEVEGVRRDVTVFNLTLGNSGWHFKQLLRRPVEEYDSTRGPVIFADGNWSKPDAPLVRLTPEELDSMPGFYRLSKPVRFTAGSLSVLINPADLPHSGLDSARLKALQIIRDQLGIRPIYFATTTGGVPDQLGFTPYLVTQGLVRKLSPELLTPSDSLVPVRGFGLVDVSRTEELLWSVYQGGDSAARHRPLGWIDRPSELVLGKYANSYYLLAALLEQRDPELAQRSRMRADAIANNVISVRRAGGR